MNPFFITTPIYYVNAKPHLGHAYSTIVADCMARFHRAMGQKTFFLTGTDEHGDKIVQAAEKNGATPQEYVDAISTLFRNLWPQLNISNDDFIRTTEERHKKVVQDILQRVYDKGEIYFGEYGGHYCYGCERFYTEKELEDGLCPQHQNKPTFISEKNYFFRMSKYTDWLLDHIEKHPDFIRPERYRNEVVSLLQSGELEDLCISRPKSRLEWGIELPFDEGYVTYVWFDALINYVSALGGVGADAYDTYWPVAQHLVAKDILKPHAVFWPTMLKAAGLEPYQHLNVHGYWLVKDTKMSKSLGNVIEPLEMAERYGLDAFRYFLLREMRFGNDASFSPEALEARYNADLANDLGNLFNRALSMTHKYFGGEAPAPAAAGELEDELQRLGLNAAANYQQLFDRVEFSKGLDALWELVRGLNRYIDQAAPWTLFKEQKTDQLAGVMYTVLEGMRKSAALLYPVMPQVSAQLLAQLGLEDAAGTGLAREAEEWGLLEPGTAVAKTSNMFPRIEPPKEEKQPAPKAKKQKSAKETPAKADQNDEFIEFEDFTKVDLRVGAVLVVEKHPKADRLYRLEIELGEEKPRQIIAGLAEHFTPDQLLGTQVTVVANLKPRKLRGLESQGMVLAVKSGDGMQLLTTTGPVDPGSKAS